MACELIHDWPPCAPTPVALGLNISLMTARTCSFELRVEHTAHAAVVGLSDSGREVGEITACVFDRGGLPPLSSSSSSEFFVAHMQRDGSGQQVEADLIAIVDQRDPSAHGRR